MQTILITAVLLAAGSPAQGSDVQENPPVLRPVVEVEEDVYRYKPADNGAGPMWCTARRAWCGSATRSSPAAWRRSRTPSR